MCGAAASVLFIAASAAAQERSFDIPSEAAVKAIPELARQAGVQIVAPADELKGVVTPAVKGTFELHAALQQLISRTDMRVISDDGQTIILKSQVKKPRAALNEGAVLQPVADQTLAQAAPPPPPPPADAQGSDELQTIVVTGSTSKRTVLNASVAVTSLSSNDLDQKAPRGTDDVLEMVPGIFVEGTAGPVSNNYSVRGLPGGSQKFIRLIEDGMPAIYGGLNDDEVFQNDISIDHVEALEGGSSGILTPNAAGASINFISRKLNFDQGGGIARITGTTYGDRRADIWYSAPVPGLKDTAFAVSGYYDSDPGTRSSPFRYDTYHMKVQLEHHFEDDASVRLTYKTWDEHDPYYADQPYAYNNGKISSIPGLNTQSGSIIGKGLGSITVPDSCA